MKRHYISILSALIMVSHAGQSSLASLALAPIIHLCLTSIILQLQCCVCVQAWRWLRMGVLPEHHAAHVPRSTQHLPALADWNKLPHSHQVSQV